MLLKTFHENHEKPLNKLKAELCAVVGLLVVLPQFRESTYANTGELVPPFELEATLLSTCALTRGPHFASPKWRVCLKQKEATKLREFLRTLKKTRGPYSSNQGAKIAQSKAYRTFFRHRRLLFIQAVLLPEGAALDEPLEGVAEQPPRRLGQRDVLAKELVLLQNRVRRRPVVLSHYDVAKLVISELKAAL